jgi:hypothetical protein
MGNDFWGNDHALLLDLGQDFLHVNGIPNHDRISDQGKASISLVI